MTDEAAEMLRKNPVVKSVVRNVFKEADPTIFPYSKSWSVDNLGPIYIPQQGKTVALNAETLPFYKRIISVYENNDLKATGNEVAIETLELAHEGLDVLN